MNTIIEWSLVEMIIKAMHKSYKPLIWDNKCQLVPSLNSIFI